MDIDKMIVNEMAALEEGRKNSVPFKENTPPYQLSRAFANLRDTAYAVGNDSMAQKYSLVEKLLRYSSFTIEKVPDKSLEASNLVATLFVQNMASGIMHLAQSGSSVEDVIQSVVSVAGNVCMQQFFLGFAASQAYESGIIDTIEEML